MFFYSKNLGKTILKKFLNSKRYLNYFIVGQGFEQDIRLVDPFIILVDEYFG